MRYYRLINTDNFNGDYPNERFLCEQNSEGKCTPCVFNAEEASAVQQALNKALGHPNPYVNRYWMVVENDYQLKPGFTP